MTTQAASIQTNLTKRVRDLKTLLVQLREELALSDNQLRRFVASHDTAQLNSTLYSQNERYRDRTTAEITRGTAALVAHGIDPQSPPEGRAPRVRGVITSLGKRDLIEHVPQPRLDLRQDECQDRDHARQRETEQ